MTVITPCRPAEPHETPKTARRLATVAEANGWEVAVTWAKHWSEEARPPRAVETIAVRMWRGNVRLAGLWHDGKFKVGLAPFRRFGADELRRIVAMSRAELADYASERAA